MSRPTETELYPPVKAFLEGQGYTVKGEIGAVDVMAVRGAEPPVLVELKTGWSLSLFHQGIQRQDITPHVYLAVPTGAGRRALAALRANLRLARRLGLGVLTVRLSDGLVTVQCDPGPFQPRLRKAPAERLLREFARRRGDPNAGGATRVGLVTAYRQDCETLARHLAAHGPCKGADVARATGVARATTMMRDNHHGWFRKLGTGIYALSPEGARQVAQGAVGPEAGAKAGGVRAASASGPDASGGTASRSSGAGAKGSPGVASTGTGPEPSGAKSPNGEAWGPEGPGSEPSGGAPPGAEAASGEGTVPAPSGRAEPDPGGAD